VVLNIDWDVFAAYPALHSPPTIQILVEVVSPLGVACVPGQPPFPYPYGEALAIHRWEECYPASSGLIRWECRINCKLVTEIFDRASLEIIHYRGRMYERSQRVQA
jgi:hypothetical protein